MKKGIETRYIIHKILIILKTRPIGLDRIFAEKVEGKNFSISDRNMIKNVVLNTMRYHLFSEEILKKFAKNIDKSSNSYFLLLSAITQLLVLKFKDFAVINSIQKEIIYLESFDVVERSFKEMSLDLMLNLKKKKIKLSKLKDINYFSEPAAEKVKSSWYMKKIK